MRGETLKINEKINSNELICKKIKEHFLGNTYEVTMPYNQWTLRKSLTHCVLVKKNAWNAACIEIDSKKGVVDVFSVIPNSSLDAVFRRQLGVLGMLLLEPSWKTLRKEVATALMK
ncbi:hypothetical protein [Tenacibaculum maritimum]|uniref:Uncharacterized protein n=1 Tax=Tenacibaculum maritimum NCIMB 2154 TaxID=1349785 RepID=A0A2H1E7X6_9FLAO|nr:hypothetical protein [Tenacibaculum maritimum]MCD9564214.1 hypothetical protein [Tenacibaculum maritimum]MCD9567067.1 hypothetical protein [Tenacibaculum maritimum]MCD9580281.1 hypothetical protein [Tenacibaculum maritimum]MCD9597992.1 hypothetical protein [Tenacibaculum maritimum]MCD9614943.1 hypothetical protein [Tenacibaculum maritimum]